MTDQAYGTSSLADLLPSVLTSLGVAGEASPLALEPTRRALTFWRRSIQARVVISTVLLSAVVFSVVGWFLLQQTRDGLLENRVEAVVTEANGGTAAARKLLRSVFMKGLAASCLESLRAARAAGCEQWMREEIVGVLERGDEELLERLVTGSARHATRRIAEVQDARELLTELGVEPRVTEAAGGWLAVLERERERDA